MSSYAWSTRSRITNIEMGDRVLEAYSIAFAAKSGDWDYARANYHMGGLPPSFPGRIGAKKAAARTATYKHRALGIRYIVLCHDDRGVPAVGDVLYRIPPDQDPQPWYHDSALERLIKVGELYVRREGRRMILCANVDKRKFWGVRTPGGCVVKVGEGREGPANHELRLRLDLVNHSPTGFEWGYGGSGPHQLSLALLAEAVGDRRALELYNEFLVTFLVDLRSEEWEIPFYKVQQWADSTDYLRRRA